MINVIDDNIILICPNCNKSVQKALEGKKYRKVNMTCACGHTKTYQLNYRISNRIELVNFGASVLLSDTYSSFRVIVENISIKGIKIVFDFPIVNYIHLEDIISIKYQLTDPHKTVINESLRVVRIEGDRIIGAEVYEAVPYSTQLKRKYFWLSSFSEDHLTLEME